MEVTMDDALTPEERQALFRITDARIKALQIKALKRLAMTDEEKALFKAWTVVQNTPGAPDAAAILAACADPGDQHTDTH
jgi:hypothetical protein